MKERVIGSIFWIFAGAAFLYALNYAIGETVEQRTPPGAVSFLKGPRG